MSDASSSSPRSVQSPKNNGLVVEGPPWGLEKIFDYEEGGHHPLHLRDLVHDRYQVIHKLGSGGYANVWLCIDTSSSSPKYVAVKVIMAEGSTADCLEARVTRVVEVGCGQEEASRYLSLPLDQFQITGPNGTHYAFVYPVLGPWVSRLSHLAKLDDPGPALRKVCLDATQALAILHEHRICHGDFRPANILSRVWGLDGLPEEKVLQILGEPKTTQVVTESGESHDLESAPKYLVYPVNWEDVLAKNNEPGLETGSACLTDFGESFEMDDPPPEVGIPEVYCSPEQALEQKVGTGSDLWALGCTLFEIRTGRKMFDTFEDDVDECLYTIATILGRYPEPWWSETWEARKDFFEDDADASGKVVDICKGSSLQSNDAAQGEGGSNAHKVVYERAKPRSLEEAIRRGLVYESDRGPQRIQRDISTGEAKIFADLLAKLLRYNPEDRIPASSVLQHDWFRLGT